MRSRPPVLLLLAAVVFSGAIQAAISAPLSWIWLHPISFIPALWAFDRLEGRQALLAGWLYGFAAQATIFSWIVHTVSTFSNLPLPVAVLILGLFSAVFGFYGAVFGWGVGHVKRMAGRAWPFAIAAWFVACEFLNPQLFPYFQGVCWYQATPLFLVTAVTGVAGMSFLILLCNAVLYGLLDRRLRGEDPAPGAIRSGAVALVVLVVAGLAYSQVRLGLIEDAEKSAPSITLGMVQTNQDVYARHALLRQSKTGIADDHAILMQQAYVSHPDIDAFVLPEGALHGRPDWPINFRVRKLVDDTGAEVWTGGSSSSKNDAGEREWFNSAFQIARVAGEDGALHAQMNEQRYDKNVLLPFGEYMPLRDVLPFLKKIQGVGNYQGGDGVIIYSGPRSAKFAFLICYEAILSRYVRRAVGDGANLLVNITYDAWFGDTANPHQHFMLSAMQAAQYGVPLVRSATTGISAFVDARGVVTATTDIFTRDVLVKEVKLVRLPGLYAVLGDWVAWLCVLACGGLLTAGWLREGRGARAGWPLGLFLGGLVVNGAIVVLGIGPLG